MMRLADLGKLAIMTPRVILKVPGGGNYLILCYFRSREWGQREVGAIVGWFSPVSYALDPEEWV